MPAVRCIGLGGVPGSMTEICLGIVGEDAAAAVAVAAAEPYDRTSVAARRRRMEIRRQRCIDGVESMGKPEVLSRKRQRSGISVHPRIVLLKREFSDVKGEEDETDQDMVKPEAIISAFTRSVASEQPPKYGTMSVCGLRRDMEDAVSIRPDFLSRAAGKHHYFGVFDGHGCSHVASWCKDRLHELVAEEVDKLESVPPPLLTDWKGLMERSFTRMDEDVVVWGGASSGEQRGPICRCEMQMPRCDHVGSTAVVAVVGPELIVVANCGDSRAVLSRRGAAVPLSIDHKPDRPDELQRIEVAGGRVIYWDGPRVLGVLAMSRAIGDGYLKPYVTAEPEVTVTEREEEDECLILASDGLWDVVANETACEIVRTCLRSSGEGSEKACSEAATLLTKMALARRSADNISVVVVDLRPRHGVPACSRNGVPRAVPSTLCLEYQPGTAGTGGPCRQGTAWPVNTACRAGERTYAENNNA